MPATTTVQNQSTRPVELSDGRMLLPGLRHTLALTAGDQALITAKVLLEVTAGTPTPPTERRSPAMVTVPSDVPAGPVDLELLTSGEYRAQLRQVGGSGVKPWSANDPVKTNELRLAPAGNGTFADGQLIRWTGADGTTAATFSATSWAAVPAADQLARDAATAVASPTVVGRAKLGAPAGAQGYDLTTPLSVFRAALVQRDTRRITMVTAGSSTTAGTAATAASKRYVNLLAGYLQAAYPLASGSHPGVAVEGATGSGISKGLLVVNYGDGGTRSNDYLTSTRVTSIAALAPNMVLHMIGANDYGNGVTPAAFKTNLLAQIASLRAAIGVPCVHLLVNTYARYDAAAQAAAVAPWSQFGDAMRQIAEAAQAAGGTNDVAFIDLAPSYTRIGIPGSDPLGLMNADHIHQVDDGHAFMADQLRQELLVPRSFSTSSSADTTAPTVPTSLAASPGNGVVGLNWTASTDAVGVTGYRVYRGGTLVATVTSGTTFTDTGRTNGTAYSYTVSAIDAAGNESAQTAAVTATPSAGADTTAPTAPTNLVATPGNAQVSLAWSPSADAVGVAGYKVYRGGALVGSPTTTSYVDAGRTNGTAYSYDVTAVDAAGNESAHSSSATATPQTGPVLTTFTSDGASGGDVTTVEGRSTDAAGGGTSKPYVVSGSTADFAISNAAFVRGTARTSAYAFGVAMPSADQQLVGTIKTMPVGASLTFDGRRASVAGSTPDTYRVLVAASTGAITLAKRVGGTTTTLSTGAYTAAAGDVVGIRLVGTQISIVKNGALLETVTDSAITAAGYAGIASSSALTSESFDDLVWSTIA